jgi:hypothetical protein
MWNANGSNPGSGAFCVLGIVGAMVLSGCVTGSESEQTAEIAEALCTVEPPEYGLAWDRASPWFNVRSSCGSGDVTACVQAYLDGLQYQAIVPGRSPVIYFPNQSYTISNTLEIHGIHGVTIVGQDPRATILSWAGPPAATCPVSSAGPLSCDRGNMFRINGSSHVRIARMTLKGNGKANALIRESYYPGIPGGFQATGCEFSDLILRSARYGILAGLAAAGAQGDDQNTVRRVTFIELSEAGFAVVGQMALNSNVWESSFTRCKYGIFSHGGNVDVYSSYFQKSTIADVFNGADYDFTLVGNTSIGSPVFFQSGDLAVPPPLHGGGEMALITGNFLDVTSSMAILAGHAHSLLVVDNVIRTAFAAGSSSALPVAVYDHAFLQVPAPASFIVTGNRFNRQVSDALCTFMGNGPDFGSRQYCWPSVESPHTAVVHANDTRGGYFYANHFLPEVAPPVKPPILPAAPPLKTATRRARAGCYDLQNNPRPGCLDTAGVQAAIDNAIAMKAAMGPGRAIVHLSAGIYLIDASLVIPAGKQVEIFGDGGDSTGTVLRWVGADDGYMFELPSPSYAGIHDLSIVNASYGSATRNPLGRGIRVHSEDQPHGVVYLNQVRADRVASLARRPADPPTRSSDNVGFYMEGFDKLNVEVEQSAFVAADVAIRIIGGGAGATSMSLVKPVKFFGPALSGTWLTQFDLRNFANLYVNGVAAEGFTHGFRLGGNGASGRLTLVNGKEGGTTDDAGTGARPPQCGEMLIDEFQGDVSLFGVFTTMPVHVTAAGASSASVLAFGLVYANGWQWSPSGAPDGHWISNSDWWNEDGPPSPSLSLAPFIPGVLRLPWDPQQLDCAGYSPTLDYSGLDPATPLLSTATGIFHADVASSRVHFLNNSAQNLQSQSNCRDVAPSSSTVAAVEASLAEIRRASPGAPRPCERTVTDARFYRVNIGAEQTHTAFAIEP